LSLFYILWHYSCSMILTKLKNHFIIYQTQGIMKIKNFLLISGLLFTVLVSDSCKKSTPYVDPVDACFAFPAKSYKVGELVNFTNCSQYAFSYHWSFGDGITSQDKHVQHSFSQPGIYSVVMTAYGESDQDQDVQQVVVEASTDLDILVMYFLTDDPVSNCDVTLYATEADWQNFANPLIDAKTDLAGSVIFSGLNPVVYYMDAYKFGADNLFYSNENIGNSTVKPLVEDEVNYYNVYVELLQSASAAKRQKAVIKKIERTTANDKFRQKYRKGEPVQAVYNLN